MSLRTIQRVGLVSGLAVLSLGLAACGDDGDKKKETAGDGDSGSDKGDDSGVQMDAATLKADQVMCGTTICDGVTLPVPPNVKACCLPDNTCGLETAGNLEGPTAPTCVARDVPGVASESCGAIWDKVDFADETGKPDAGMEEDQTDGKFTRKLSDKPLIVTNFSGCCTAAGACSIDFTGVDVVIASKKLPSPLNVGYGCPDPSYVGLQEASMPAGFGDTIGCDPATGMVTEEPAAPAQPEVPAQQ